MLNGSQIDQGGSSDGMYPLADMSRVLLWYNITPTTIDTSDATVSRVICKWGKRSADVVKLNLALVKLDQARPVLVSCACMGMRNMLSMPSVNSGAMLRKITTVPRELYCMAIIEETWVEGQCEHFVLSLSRSKGRAAHEHCGKEHGDREPPSQGISHRTDVDAARSCEDCDKREQHLDQD